MDICRILKGEVFFSHGCRSKSLLSAKFFSQSTL